MYLWVSHLPESLATSTAGMVRLMMGRSSRLLRASARLRSAMIINMRPKLEIHKQDCRDMAGKNCGFKWGNLITTSSFHFDSMYEDPSTTSQGKGS
ncbi:hypothetical protein C4D60_Mb00t19200 [Musa balbisiana]|uniref:Uncharacterized protein n=1 Tax=Musa balbisiana TaxID=52838 RepID=A0A4S8I431_MUSBA|nr:hypothetical protein C4D60_Mb00t19200 [Musa balbisiana]